MINHIHSTLDEYETELTQHRDSLRGILDRLTGEVPMDIAMIAAALPARLRSLRNSLIFMGTMGSPSIIEKVENVLSLIEEIEEIVSALMTA